MPWSRLDEVFVETTEHGNLDWLKCLLKSGANINATSWDGYSALIKASKEGDIDLIEFLIENGADINAKTSHGFTPLLYAAKNGHHSIIELLVVNGADIEIKDKAGLTPLMHLARNGYIDMVSNFITQDQENETNSTSFETVSSLSQGTYSKLLVFFYNIKSITIKCLKMQKGLQFVFLLYSVDRRNFTNCKVSD